MWLYAYSTRITLHMEMFSAVFTCRVVADLGFSRGRRRQLPKWDYFENILPKTAWKWKNLDPRGAHLWRPLCVCVCVCVKFKQTDELDES